MAYDEISVVLPVQDATQSVEIGEITETTVDVDNGIQIVDALDNKNNSLVIVINGSGTATIAAGDNYPNAILGSLDVSCSGLTAILLEDISRFENKDGSICIDFSSEFTGTIYAVAKRAGVKPVDEE